MREIGIRIYKVYMALSLLSSIMAPIIGFLCYYPYENANPRYFVCIYTGVIIGCGILFIVVILNFIIFGKFNPLYVFTNKSEE